MKSKFSGVITALITPFSGDNVDERSFKNLIQDQIKKGVDGFVINGTTGESPTLEKEEVAKLYKLARELADKRPLIIGTGSNSTKKTIEDSKAAEKLGADAVLVVVPYYNKPPQRGLLEHFKAVANAINIPLILYNVPGRTITSLELETIKKLSEHPNIIGIKEASGNIEFAKKIREQCGESFLLLSGDDGTYDKFMQVGGDGVISVASHIIPQAMKSLKIEENKELIDYLFVEANPIPVKAALKLMNIIDSDDLRLPLVKLQQNHREQLKELMKKKGLV